MGPTCVLSALDGPHVGPMNLAFKEVISFYSFWLSWDKIHVGFAATRSNCNKTPYLTYCDLVTPYNDIDLGQHWLSQCRVPWRHQAITRTNVESSLVRSNDIHLMSKKLIACDPPNAPVITLPGPVGAVHGLVWTKIVRPLTGSVRAPYGAVRILPPRMRLVEFSWMHYKLTGPVRV